jgi:uncharacterized protein (TIGR03083 family)
MTTTSIVRPEPDRSQTMAGLLDQYRTFAQLVAACNNSDWTRATRCAGWQVRDVAGHVVGQALDTVNGTIGHRTPDEQAAALRGESPMTLASQLQAATNSMTRLAAMIDDAFWSSASPVAGFTVGQGMHALLHDAYLHGDDVRAALGLPVANGPGLHASLDFVLGALLRDEVSAAEPAIARLLSLPADHFSEKSGLGAHDFLLAATGRGDPRRLLLPDVINIYR